ncbi:putative reticulocyte-binding protein [Clavispora lusitaniae]|uniref:Uncharacterized protein n=3 Tax=Clavispora lusitaniae TaxID=36911 RepID=C4Y5P3_CLAL4|nr:uncharacterized protein CLUG_03477 [Clavispora lusitaniae ATCC 42720]KAF5210243.1 hypothetical protein E0198_003110 [Clavispora lusitaniae]EEQ39349.1 hypothetical protein CLUG_03477 [Clavispora lusitaniae ATCC 42720]KAF7582679.1 Mediator complex subunit 2 family protein [Clavispora lusitaniae]OVF11224.1 putative stress response protein [Clavispora lusitaniae]QFZ28237.1 putative reticulocyte-binding protein [Clavispora lusitaniae]
MNLEAKLTSTLNDVLRSSGYIFEIINNNKKQSNIVTGPNNQLIPSQVTNQLAQSIAQFDQILDDTVSKFNDARWCIEQMVDSRQKQEEMKHQEEIERQRREEADRKRKEEEERKRKLDASKEEERLALEKSRREEKERLEREAKEREEKEREKRQLNQNRANGQDAMGALGSQGFDFDMNTEDLGIPNPSDILSSISYKEGNKNKPDKKPNDDDMDMNMNNVIGNNESLLDDLNMDLLGQDFDPSLGGDEEFDVDTFLNQFGGD